MPRLMANSSLSNDIPYLWDPLSFIHFISKTDQEIKAEDNKYIIVTYRQNTGQSLNIKTGTKIFQNYVIFRYVGTTEINQNYIRKFGTYWFWGMFASIWFRIIYFLHPPNALKFEKYELFYVHVKCNLSPQEKRTDWLCLTANAKSKCWALRERSCRIIEKITNEWPHKLYSSTFSINDIISREME
jgi:hypothetical protein